jgi:hypothetical protein
MPINTKNIVSNIMEKKRNPVKEAFDSLKEDYTGINCICYSQYIQDLPAETILENSKYVFSEPSYGADFYNFFMQVHDFTTEQLTVQKNALESYINKCKTNKYKNSEHLNLLTETLGSINTSLIKSDDIENVIESYIYNKHYTRLFDDISLESAVQMDKLLHNVKVSKESVKLYAEMLEDYKNSKRIQDIKDFPLLLVKNTSMFIGLSTLIVVAGSGMIVHAGTFAIGLMLSVPFFIVADLIDKRVNRSRAQSFIKIFDRQIIRATKADVKGINEMSEYIKNLKLAREELVDYVEKDNMPKKLAESMQIAQENVVTFIAPYLIPMPKKWVKGFLHAGWDVKEKVIHPDIKKMKNKEKIKETIASLEKSEKWYMSLKQAPTIESKVIKYGVYNGVNADRTLESIIELHNETIVALHKRLDELEEEDRKAVKEGMEEGLIDLVGNDMIEDIIGTLNDITADVEEPGFERTQEIENDNPPELDRSIGKQLTDLNGTNLNLYGATEPLMMEYKSNGLSDALEASIIKFIFDGETEVNYEAFNDMVRYGIMMDIVQEVDAARAVVHTARKGGEFSSKVATTVNKGIEPINNAVSELIDSVKKIDTAERRNRIIEGKFRFKLLKIVRNAIMLGAAWMINPALAAIGFIAMVAWDHKADYSVRQQIVTELKEELKLVDEKIDDAKSDSQRDKKYQLMRIKHKLEHDIERIEFNLNKM